MSFALKKGIIGCLLGPSGCGKTTVLRAVAGFQPLWEGMIALQGKRVSDKAGTLAPEKRRIGILFQDHALFPHLTVEKNIAFGLSALAPAQKRAEVERWLAMLELGGVARAYPHELSGGQQQRVALARALAPSPDLVLLDEPFSSLDPELREHLMIEVRGILKKLQATCLVVTHDQNEAFTMADEIGVMRAGEIQQWAGAYEIYHEPANPFVADFIGQGVFVPATVSAQGALATELGAVRASADSGLRPGGRVWLLIRPDDIVPDETSTLKAEVMDRSFRGAYFLYTLRLESGRKVFSLFPSHHNHPLGSRIGIKADVDHIICFARESDTPPGNGR
jgi:iron(III) transport system ATP-binding protein